MVRQARSRGADRRRPTLLSRVGGRERVFELGVSPRAGGGNRRLALSIVGAERTLWCEAAPSPGELRREQFSCDDAPDFLATRRSNGDRATPVVCAPGETARSLEQGQDMAAHLRLRGRRSAAAGYVARDRSVPVFVRDRAPHDAGARQSVEHLGADVSTSSKERYLRRTRLLLSQLGRLAIRSSCTL